MNWEERFWACWQALVESERNVDLAKAQVDAERKDILRLKLELSAARNKQMRAGWTNRQERDSEIRRLVNSGVPYLRVALQFSISVDRVKQLIKKSAEPAPGNPPSLASSSLGAQGTARDCTRR